MHCRYFSVSDCSIRVSRSFVQSLCPLHKNCTYYASILLIAFTQPLCQKFCWRNRRVPSLKLRSRSCVNSTVYYVHFYVVLTFLYSAGIQDSENVDAIDNAMYDTVILAPPPKVLYISCVYSVASKKSTHVFYSIIFVFMFSC